MYDPISPVLGFQETQPRQSTLLYVEDNPANLSMVVQLIARRKDIRLLTATEGHTGIQMARDHLPDMIMLDINLSGFSGIDVFKILRKDSSTAHIPIMALSFNTFPREIEKGLTAGFFRYLTKPYKLDELMDAIDAGMQLAAINHQGALPVPPINPCSLIRLIKMDRMTHDCRASGDTNCRKLYRTNLLQSDGKLMVRDETSLLALTNAESSDERSAELREKTLLVREEKVEKRECDLRWRKKLLALEKEKLFALRVQEISDTQIVNVTQEYRHFKLKDANEHLVIAAIESQIMA